MLEGQGKETKGQKKGVDNGNVKMVSFSSLELLLRGPQNAGHYMHMTRCVCWVKMF